MTSSRIQRRRRPASSALDRIVVNEAHRVRRAISSRAIEFEELVGYGYVGMVEAEQRYDVDRGTTIETFARYRIRGAIMDGVRQCLGVTRRRAYEHLRRRPAFNESNPDEHRPDERAESRSTCPTTAQNSESGGRVQTSVKSKALRGDATSSSRHSYEDAMAHVKAVLRTDAHLRAAPTPEELITNISALRHLRAVLGTLDQADVALLEAVYDFHGTSDSAAQFARRAGIHRSSVTRRHHALLRKLRMLMAADHQEEEGA